ncbi:MULTISPECIES: PatB family C-S lyase [unclassified Methylophaga]|jgi:cystathionine beta-lyase|uniref:MalY/PatB family protein n=1 Tax=unclassified Methylophaga TaxID=2629249 RepID=UPI000C904A4B|nr:MULTISPECIES: PatB family C-S lyase [unclassified Methylophaga]MAK67865.1 aminotransferase [Methylophaga sp.]MAY18548.1 aminotransferase [Methylophaga sp.]HAO24071.1 aminotransferase [Methylophaga sp.]|tara:strand:+ start:3107 stop:4279 length:1173 start_codon:yes stop_codon:yes gene_type:complete
MSKIDFDQKIDRSGTYSLKYDARQRLFGREDAIPLWVADMDFVAPEAVTRALTVRAEHPLYGYSEYPAALYQATQEWFLRRHHWHIATEHILICPGVVPSLHATIMALTEKHEQVIAQPPVYFPFFSAVTETQRELVVNPLVLVDDYYQMNFDQLAEQAASGAKMLLLCSPHNPGGRVWSEAELQKLLDIARQHQLIILSDEIHADLVFTGNKHIPLASLAKDVPIVTAVSASKTFNIAGLGMSMLIVPDSEHKKAIESVFNSWHVSAANPFSIEATIAAYRHGDDWLEQLLVYLQQSYEWVKQFFAVHLPKIRVLPLQSTYLIWLDCQALLLNDKQLRTFFVQQAGVAMNPGVMFGDAGSGFMRMNIAAPRSVIEQACQQIITAWENMQ